jgi:NitT/TauT family transport system substrate-binding protein
MRARCTRILAVLAAAALMPFGSARTADAQQPGPPLKISIIEATPAFHSLPLTALKTIGAEYGLQIEMLQVQGGGEAGQIFAGGHADIMTAGFDKPVGFMAKKLVDVRTFGVILHSINWSLVVPAKSEIKTVADLKGKTIGISGPGSSSDMLMRWALSKAGLNPDRDATLIALGSVANLYAGLENGRVNAAVLVRPFLTKAIDSGMARVVGDWEAMPFPNLVSIARAKDLEETPEKFIRFQSAIKSVMHRFKTDRDFALKMAKLAYPNSSVQDLGQQLDFATKVYWKGDGDMTRELYDQAVDVLVGSGRIGRAEFPSFESMVVRLPAK